MFSLIVSTEVMSMKDIGWGVTTLAALERVVSNNLGFMDEIYT